MEVGGHLILIYFTNLLFTDPWQFFFTGLFSLLIIRKLTSAEKNCMRDICFFLVEVKENCLIVTKIHSEGLFLFLLCLKYYLILEMTLIVFEDRKDVPIYFLNYCVLFWFETVSWPLWPIVNLKLLIWI